MRHLALLIVGISLIQSCESQTTDKIDWSSDIDFLAEQLPHKHYDFFTVKDKEQFVSSLEKLKSKAEGLTDLEVVLGLQQIVAGFGDSHTRINYGQLLDQQKISPLHLYWFKDGLYILQTNQENIEILGSQILSVNGTPIQTVVDSLSTLITVDNEAIIKGSIPKIIPLVQILDYFGFVQGQEIELELKNSEGIIKRHTLLPGDLNGQNRKSYAPDSLALCYKNERAFFIDYYQAKDKVYYLQYNRCWSKELEVQYRNGQNADGMPSFMEFENKVFETMKTEPIEKLVFDLRFNGGGNSLQGTKFIEKLAGYSKENPDIKLFVVLGRYTFSSAILNAMDFERLTTAIFVGEETAGKPNHFGEVKNFQLPSSGVSVYYSTKYFKRTDEIVFTLTPDVIVESDFADFSKGIDPVYEWIKEQ